FNRSRKFFVLPETADDDDESSLLCDRSTIYHTHILLVQTWCSTAGRSLPPRASAKCCLLFVAESPRQDPSHDVYLRCSLVWWRLGRRQRMYLESWRKNSLSLPFVDRWGGGQLCFCFAHLFLDPRANVYSPKYCRQGRNTNSTFRALGLKSTGRSSIAYQLIKRDTPIEGRQAQTPPPVPTDPTAGMPFLSRAGNHTHQVLK
ncbi:unnamed protein product, partial [Ectocarpus sp. 12 AP-2014]